MATLISNGDADPSQQARQILDDLSLELAYEKSLQQTESLYQEESARRLRVQILLLKDKNDNLHHQLAQEDNRIGELTEIGQDLRSQLHTSRNSLDNLQSELRLKLREIETLKAYEAQVELGSLHDVTMDSTKLLTEKLALARELSSLKPEVDHLRSQTLSYQAVLAEKLSLQRQISSLQVELETEKRATQRAVAREGKYQAEDARSAAQMESLQADLAKERKERLRIEREAQKLTADFKTRTVNLESRLDSLKTQLKATKDHLRENQSELQKARAASGVGASRSTSNIAMDEVVREPRKRVASRMDDDTIIGTPGDMRAAKKTKKGSTMLGDKSAFSITPFLNRTASFALDSPDEQNDANRADDHVDPPDHRVATAKDHEGLSTRPLGRSKTSKGRIVPQKVQKANAFENSKPEKANANVQPVHKPKKTSALEQVAEEEHDENAAPKTSQTKPNAAGSADIAEDTIENAEVKKRKRKLVGSGLTKTLFDDEEREAVTGDIAGNSVFGTLGRIALEGPKVNQRFGSAGTAKNGFGSFSPLKKDKKARAR